MIRKILSCLALPLLLLLGSSGNSAPPAAPDTPEGFNAGPDIITGDIGLFGGLEQFGSNGTQVGLAPSTTSCNAGDQFVNFFALPQTNHPVIPHNLYRMSGGSGNDERFEQIGQGWPKHAFGADQASDCFTCQPGGDFNHLGIGCSDTYANFQNAEQSDLGSRALINPFTGVFQSTANNHNGHVHDGTSHRILVEASDLNTSLNPGATYYAEVQYISSDEYAWCQAHPGQCNMYNNASYRRYNVDGLTAFTFSEVGNTVRMLAAVHAWPGATINPIEPEPGVDGRAYIAYKVTNPTAGVWHYEYALYNENLDRAIQSFSVPLGCAITLSNLGFHAPPNHPGFPNDGTQGGAGFSNAPWSSNQTTDAVSWSSETFAQNQNANAIRWGTLYNFRFDSNKPPIATNATIGFFKTGAPVTVAILGPNACDIVPSPTPAATPPNPTPTPTATPSATPPNPTPTATPPATPTPNPGPAAHALNLSTRMHVQPGDNVGIAGFIITGTAPKHILLRAIGPSITGVPSVLYDPVLELYRPGASTIVNDNWRDDPVQEAAIIATGIPPANDREAAIDATLNPGAYTAIIRGKNNTPPSGTALIEVYDLSPAVLAKLANISTRAFIYSADSLVIAGFILGGGSGNDSIVVRGIGPSIQCGGGCPSLLHDPALELRDSNGALLVANNDWQENPAQAAEISAVGLAPLNNREAAIATALPPGLYTALLSEFNHDFGLGLVEVYDFGNASFPPLPAPEQCIQNFDSVIAGNLPPGWSAEVTIGSFPSWRTSTIDPHSPPNDLFVNDQDGISDKTVTSPPILINSASALLSFHNSFYTEYDPPPAEVFWDGYVLEVSVNGGPFNDVTDPAVGGTFVSGGYTGQIDGTANNPLAGRMAWSGNSGGYINTVIGLGSNLMGQAIRLRFRMGTDEAVAAPGTRIDGLAVTGGSCFNPTPTPPPSPTPGPQPCGESFDNLIAPALPLGWSAEVVSGDFPSWRTSTIGPHSPPNDLFVTDQPGISDKIVTSSPIDITSAEAVLSFHNNFNTEYDGVFWDGYVLEVSVNEGAFVDVTDPSIGGSFVSGGYTGQIDSTTSNPLAGRWAWSGNSGGYINTVINLGPGLVGHSIRLRFRMGTDLAVGAPGVRIDGLAVSGGSCFSPKPTPTPFPTPTPGPEQCAENFDNVTAPTLPPGWIAEVVSGDFPPWQTSTTKPDSPPNDLFVNDQDGISEKWVTSPPILIDSASAVLTFRNNFLTEYQGSPEVFWDGYVLEVSINGGAFNDVTDPAVGGIFLSGGYTGTIDGTAANPLAGRLAWSGDSAGYINTVIGLGSNLMGQTIRLRFRMGTDEAVGAPGVRIDGLAISGSCLAR